MSFPSACSATALAMSVLRSKSVRTLPPRPKEGSRPPGAASAGPAQTRHPSATDNPARQAVATARNAKGCMAGFLGNTSRSVDRASGMRCRPRSVPVQAGKVRASDTTPLRVVLGKCAGRKAFPHSHRRSQPVTLEFLDDKTLQAVTARKSIRAQVHFRLAGPCQKPCGIHVAVLLQILMKTFTFGRVCGVGRGNGTW